MDFTFTEEQRAAVEAARAVFSDVAPDRAPSPALTPGAVAKDIRPGAVAGTRAHGPARAHAVAGPRRVAGLDPIALCLVLRESAKVLARVPLLESCAVATTVQRYAEDGLAAELLPRVATGELILTAAANGRSGHDPAELAVTARPESEGEGSPQGVGAGADGSGWVLDGVQTAVPWARVADRIAVPAHTARGRAVLALVPRTRDGVTLEDQVSTSGELLAEVRFDAVRVEARELIETEGCWDWLRSLLTTGTCALALGLGERVLAMTAEYTGKREQFGFPVATFQAVAVQAADRYIDLRAMEATLWQAAWRLSADAGGPLPAAADVAVAKIWASDGVRRVVQTAQHLHGGFGADTDYPLHRFHAWAKQIELSLGPATAHEEALGDLLAAHPLG
ncbi:acyl-CoA/acyl-ACP dehydrogenase [Streptomyces californicus]